MENEEIVATETTEKKLSQAEVDEIVKSRLARQAKEMSKLEAKIAEYEDVYEQKKQAEMSEMEKLQNILNKLKSENEQMKLNSVKESLISKIIPGMPISLKEAIAGTTEEEIEKNLNLLKPIFEKLDNNDKAAEEPEIPQQHVISIGSSTNPAKADNFKLSFENTNISPYQKILAQQSK